MIYITTYYNKEFGKTTLSFSVPKNKGNRAHHIKDDLDEIRKEIDRVCPKPNRLVDDKDSLTITYFPHMEISPIMVADNLQF